MHWELPTGQKQQATPSTVRKILDRLRIRESADTAIYHAYQHNIKGLAYLLGVF